MGKGTDRLKLVLAFAAIYIIWGSTYLGIRYAIETIPALAMASIRFLLAGPLFMGFALLAGAPMPTRRQWRDGFLVGTLMLAGGTGTVTWAEQWVPSGLAALLVAVMPMWILLVDWLRPNGVRPGIPAVIGLVIGFIGVVLLLDADLGLGDGYLGAAVAVVFASLFWASGSILSRHTDSPKSQIMSTGLKMLLGGVSLAVVAALAGEWGEFRPLEISLRSGLALTYLITIGSVAFVAYIWLLKASSPEKAATYAYVNPAVAVILGTLLAGEPFTAKTAIASVIIIASVLIVVTYGRKPEAAAVKEIHASPAPSVAPVPDADNKVA